MWPCHLCRNDRGRSRDSHAEKTLWLVAGFHGPSQAGMDSGKSLGPTEGDFSRPVRGTLPTDYNAEQAKRFLAIQTWGFPCGHGCLRLARGLRTAAMAAAGACGAGVTDCFGESGELAAGTGERPQKGNGDADGGRREQREIDSSITRGEPTAGGHGRRVGSVARAQLEPGAGGFAEHERRSIICRSGGRLARARVHCRAGGANLPAFRVGSGAACNKCFANRSAEGGREGERRKEDRDLDCGACWWSRR